MELPFVRANLYKLEEITSSQLSSCRNIEGAIYLEKQFLMEIQKLSPHLVSWWSEEMIKEIEEISIFTDEEGWTGRWQRKSI